MITLIGQGGVGKSRMLEQLMLEEPRIIETDQIALAQMVQPNRRLFGKDRIATPPAMVFFSRLWYVIHEDVAAHV
jgi:GTPase SAR1 family protein